MGQETSRGPAATRRGFVAGAGLAAAAQLTPWSAIAARPAAQCTPSPPSSRTAALAAAPGARTVWSTDTADRTIAGHTVADLTRARTIPVGGAPIDLAVTPGGSRAAVVTAAWDRPGLALVDLRAGRLLDRLAVGADPRAVAADARQVVVVGGGAEGTLTRVSLRTGKAAKPVALGRHPRAVVLAPDGDHAYVTLNGDAQVAVVALRSGRVVQRFATAPFPAQIAMAPDGRRAWVSHDGADDRRLTPIDLAHRKVKKPVKVGGTPAGLAFDRAGRLLAVAESDTGRVSVLDARTGARRRRLHVGGAPRGIAAARTSLIVCDWETGALTRLAVRGRSVTRV